MRITNVLLRIDRGAKLVEDGLLAGLLFAMIALAGTQIFLRNVVDSGIAWADPLLRIMVLWLGLMGAVAASRDNRHINIDLLSKFLPDKARLAVQIIVDLFTAVVCGLVAWHAGRFISDEMAFAAPGLWGLPIWVFEIVIPVAFGLITLRYVIFVAGHVRALLTPGADT